MRSWLILIGLLATGCATLPRTAPGVAAPVPAHSGCPQSAEQQATSVIRSPDEFARSLLIEGCRRSPTLRALGNAIARTDGVVYITTGHCPVRILRGCLLHTIEDTGNARYLWIRVKANDDRTELVVTMAHELQHALEVLERKQLRSQRDLLDFYKSAESQAYGGVRPSSLYRTYETTAAIDVAGAVRAEMKDSSGVLTTGERN